MGQEATDKIICSLKGPGDFSECQRLIVSQQCTHCKWRKACSALCPEKRGLQAEEIIIPLY